MNYVYLHFFNIQYWYCVIISIFGAKCTYVDSYTGQTFGTGGASGVNVGTSTGSGVVGTVHPSFWDWLFGVNSSGASAAPTGFFGTLFAIIAGIFGFLWALFSTIAYIAAFLLFLIIVISLIGLLFIRIRDGEMYANIAPAKDHIHPLRGRWQDLLASVMSSNPSGWKDGIVGADLMLGELFSNLGYEGANTAERLRKIPDGAFANLPSAWEAHRIKNFVFAPGSHFILTQREAFRTMKLYEQVFKEFDFI